jgi:hypothetical protein
MAIITGVAIVLIVRTSLVLVVRSRLGVFVAENALEHREIRGIGVTIGTLVPLIPMRTRIDREVLRIVIPIGR